MEANEIAKISLIQLFYSERFSATNVITNVPFDLNQKVHTSEPEFQDITLRLGTRFYVWSIELGLKPLSVESGKTYIECIASIIHENNPHLSTLCNFNRDVAYPTHIITNTWIGDDRSGKDEFYINAITQEDLGEIIKQHMKIHKEDFENHLDYSSINQGIRLLD